MFAGHIHEDPARWDIYPQALRRALKLLASGVPAACTPGVYQLDDDRMIMQVLDLTTKPRSEIRPESHRKYIDVQFLAEGGPEDIGWYPNMGDSVVDEDLFDTPRDICFWKENPAATENIIHMKPGSYAVFFPWDMHMPAQQAGDEPAHLKKIVIKVLLESVME